MALRIKELLKDKKITQAELAEKLGINRVNISAQINGNPTLDSLQKIADVLNVDISELFEQKHQNSVVCPHCGGRIKIEKSL